MGGDCWKSIVVSSSWPRRRSFTAFPAMCALDLSVAFEAAPRGDFEAISYSTQCQFADHKKFHEPFVRVYAFPRRSKLQQTLGLCCRLYIPTQLDLIMIIVVLLSLIHI